MLPKFLILVIGASILAFPAPARAHARVQIVPGVSAVADANSSTPGVLKDGGGTFGCVEELPDGSWRIMETGDPEIPCSLSLPNGVFIRLWKGEIVTTETEGDLVYGTVRIYTSGLSYRLFGDQRHLIEPNAIIEMVVEGNLTHILSKEGNTSVIACGVSEDDTCVRRGFTLLEGDLISLQREGQVQTWENVDGDDLNLESTGGCSVGNSSQPSFWIVLMIWTLMWLRRREIRDS